MHHKRSILQNDSLTALAVYNNVDESRQKNLLQQGVDNQKKMQVWAHQAPMNHLHKFNLVEAEKARVLGRVLEAEEFYERAIAGARENEYIQEEALGAARR